MKVIDFSGESKLREDLADAMVNALRLWEQYTGTQVQVMFLQHSRGTFAVTMRRENGVLSQVIPGVLQSGTSN